jgi:hypothetical protein
MSLVFCPPYKWVCYILSGWRSFPSTFFYSVLSFFLSLTLCLGLHLQWYKKTVMKKEGIYWKRSRSFVVVLICSRLPSPPQLTQKLCPPPPQFFFSLCSRYRASLLKLRVGRVFWAQNATRLSARCYFTGPKKLSISRAQPPPTCPSNGCCPHQKHYAWGRINHRCINSHYVQ